MNNLSQQLASIENFPQHQQRLLSQLIQHSSFNASFSATQVAALLSEQPNIEQLLTDLVPLAQSYSVSPISNFKVGAVALAKSGAIYLGANMEFFDQALNQSIHAEQAVISNAWHHDETQLTKIAVSASPCGHCRQFMNELVDAGALEILLPQQSPVTLASLLPLSFGPTDLGVNQNLMASDKNNIANTNADELIIQASNGAQLSYSPYSKSPSGIALATKSAKYVGRYAENCAYNPSLSPLQSALIALHLANDKISDITQAVLGELKSAPVSQFSTSYSLLAQLCEVPLKHHRV